MSGNDLMCSKCGLHHHPVEDCEPEIIKKGLPVMKIIKPSEITEGGQYVYRGKESDMWLDIIQVHNHNNKLVYLTADMGSPVEAHEVSDLEDEKWEMILLPKEN